MTLQTKARPAPSRGDAPENGLVLYEGLAGFRYALRRFLAFSEAETGAAGITPLQYQALLEIRIHPEQATAIGELADQLLLRHHGAVQLVDRLQKAGLVKRRHASTDRRRVLVVMTAKGRELLRHLATAHMEELLRQEPLLVESLRRLRLIHRGDRLGSPA